MEWAWSSKPVTANLVDWARSRSFLPHSPATRAAVMRFRREFEAAGRLKHLNLVAAFEADEDRGVHFLVMDYVEGVNLDRVVGQQGPLSVPQASTT